MKHKAPHGLDPWWWETLVVVGTLVAVFTTTWLRGAVRDEPLTWGNLFSAGLTWVVVHLVLAWRRKKRDEKEAGL